MQSKLLERHCSPIVLTTLLPCMIQLILSSAIEKWVEYLSACVGPAKPKDHSGFLECCWIQQKCHKFLTYKPCGKQASLQLTHLSDLEQAASWLRVNHTSFFLCICNALLWLSFVAHEGRVCQQAGLHTHAGQLWVSTGLNACTHNSGSRSLCSLPSNVCIFMANHAVTSIKWQGSECFMF